VVELSHFGEHANMGDAAKAVTYRSDTSDRRDASAAPVLNVGEMPTDSRVHGR
jgi:hypothetical protein